MMKRESGFDNENSISMVVAVKKGGETNFIPFLFQG